LRTTSSIEIRSVWMCYGGPSWLLAQEEGDVRRTLALRKGVPRRAKVCRVARIMRPYRESIAWRNRKQRTYARQVASCNSSWSWRFGFLQGRASKAGGVAYQHRSIKCCAHTWKASSRLMLNADSRWSIYTSCGKTCEGIIARQRRAPESFIPSCAYFKKNRDTKISFAAQVRYYSPLQLSNSNPRSLLLAQSHSQWLRLPVRITQMRPSTISVELNPLPLNREFPSFRQK